MKNLKAIFFDADGTLINHEECEKQALMHMFSTIGLDYKDEYQDIFRPLDTGLWETGCYDNKPVPYESIPTFRFEVLFRQANVQYGDYANANALFMERFAETTALMENAVETVEKLYNDGLAICIVTNGIVRLQSPRVLNSKIGKFVSHIIVSEEVGAHKPNPLIFNELLCRLKLRPDNVIMVGDSLANDIQGAANVGIKSIWFNPMGVANETGISPDYEIGGLLEVMHIVSNL